MELLKKIFNNNTVENDGESSESLLKKLPRKKIIGFSIGGGVLLAIFIGYVMVQNIRAEIASFHNETPIPQEPNLKADSSQKNNQLEHLRNADNEIQKKQLNGNISSQMDVVSMDWENVYEKNKALEREKALTQASVNQGADSVNTNKMKSDGGKQIAMNVKTDKRKSDRKSANRQFTDRKSVRQSYKIKRGKDWDNEKITTNVMPVERTVEPTKQPESDSDPYFNTTKIIVDNTPKLAISENKKDKSQYIAGVVNGKQLITNGKRVSFRILEPTRILGFEVPKNTLVSGLAFLGSGRVTFQISSIHVSNQTLPIQFKTLDQDLVEGLAYEGDNPVRNDIRQGTTQAMEDVTNSAISYIPQYAGVAYAGRSLARGISRAVGTGTNRKKSQEIWLEDGYKIFFVLKN